MAWAICVFWLLLIPVKTSAQTLLWYPLAWFRVDASSPCQSSQPAMPRRRRGRRGRTPSPDGRSPSSPRPSRSQPQPRPPDGPPPRRAEGRGARMPTTPPKGLPCRRSRSHVPRRTAKASAPPGVARPSSSPYVGPPTTAAVGPGALAPPGLVFVALTPEEARLLLLLRQSGTLPARASPPSPT